MRFLPARPKFGIASVSRRYRVGADIAVQGGAPC